MKRRCEILKGEIFEGSNLPCLKCRGKGVIPKPKVSTFSSS